MGSGRRVMCYPDGMKQFASAILLLALAAAPALAWQPAQGFEQRPLWPGAMPHALSATGPEVDAVVKHEPVAGKPWLAVGNVTRPTMTVYRAKGVNTGAAVVVFPGGGYTILAMDLEGTEVCDWLTSRGITAVLLKYRVPGTGFYPRAAPYKKSGPYPRSPYALSDAQRAIRLVRVNAVAWGIDPKKVGVLGFSAGGHLAAATAMEYDRPAYQAVDAADHQSCRPDFAVPIYPGHLWDDEKPFATRAYVRVHRGMPPIFLLHGT